jgi:hypothetical protein
MPDNNALSNLPYPQYQPPKPLDPVQALSLLSGAQAFQRNQLQLGADKAIGDEYRNALTPNGLDINRLVTGLKSNPAASFGLPSATTGVLQQQGHQFENLTKMNGAVMDFIGSMAADPTLTKEKLLHAVTSFSRANNIPGNVIGPWTIGLPNDDAGVRNSVQTLANAARGAAASAELTDVVNPDGSVTRVPKGAQIFAGGGVPGAVPGSPPLGAGTSAEAYQRDLLRAGNFKQDIFPLTRALELAKSLGPGGMAPGSKGRQEFESYVYGLMPSLVPPAMQDKIKNYAELEKYLVNNASQRAQNLGPHTNEGLAAATTGSPNVHINDLAGIDLIKAQIALRRMEHAQTLQAAKAGPANYTAEKAKFAAGQDPQAYAVDLMEPEQRQKLHITIRGTARDRFNDSLAAAIDSGAIDAPPEVIAALKKRKAARQ